MFVDSGVAEEAPSLDVLQAEIQTTNRRLEQVRASAAAVDQILDIGLASDEVGELLHESRSRLPLQQDLLSRVAARERTVAEAKLDLVRMLDQHRLAEAADKPGLKESILAQEAYVAAVEEALEAEKQLATEASALTSRLDEKLLWIRSASPIDVQWVNDVGAGVAWLAAPGQWRLVGQAALRGAASHPVLSGLGVVGILGLLIGKRRFKRREAQLAELTRRFSTDTFSLTLRAFLLTVLRVLPGPAALLGVCALLLGAGGGFPVAIAWGSLAASVVWFGLSFSRAICREGGLAAAHLGWDARSCHVLARHLRWLIPIQVSAAFVDACTRATSDELYSFGLGRLAFLLATLALVVFLALVFRPRNGVLSPFLSRDGWAWRLRRVLYIPLVALPLGLAVAASVGYYYTATVIQTRLFLSGLIVLLGVAAYSLFARWISIARRRVALKQARQRLAEEREARERSEDADAPVSGEATPELDPQVLDVEAASEQTRTLLRIGAIAGIAASLWAVWADVLPALAVLESVKLTGATLDAESEVIVPAVTLWSLTLVALLIAVTVVAARNLPALLELVVLARFPIDGGTRYAIVTLVRYVVIAGGVIWASHLIGIDWGRAQWIIAALGVGLGFGLQEIVANFVSGLIILFERPVRVGDVVTVGEISGTVSRIQIRATTITDWDNKEILVPNKAFITDRVINWTLSSPITRLLIPVGVAYGSDVVKAHDAIANAVRSVPAVLDDPAPSILLIGFGDSSLDFEVRAFVGQLAQRLPTTHDLHTAIESSLREAGIEIPFPQHDLWLRAKDTSELATDTLGGQPNEALGPEGSPPR